MRRVSRATDLAARRAWLWRNKFLFHRPIGASVPRLLVDVSTIIRHDAQTGIQRVVRSVWSELLKRDGEGFILQPVFATNRHGYCNAPLDFLEGRPRSSDRAPVGAGPGDKFLGLDLSAHLLPKYRQQLRAWRKHGASIHVIVYDLLPIQRPDWFTGAASSNFRKWLDVIALDTDNALCISDFVASQLSLQLGSARPHIGRLAMGADMSASRPTSGLSLEVTEALEQMRECPTILMVGTIEPRKGYEAALSAFEYLWQGDRAGAPSLVIVGKSGWKTASMRSRLLAHPQLGRRLRWLDRVSDEGLTLLYSAARAVLVASRGEGFGLPLVEAAMHRRHVLARDLEVFREQRLANVVYFSDDSPASLGDRVMDLLAASVHTPPAADLPTWRHSVDRLMVDLGLGHDEMPSVAQSICYA